MESNIPIELLEQLERGNVLIFVGEGIHCGALPSSVELAHELARRCDYPLDEPTTLPRVAGYYEMVRDRNDLIQFLRDRLDNPALKPQRAHGLVAQLGSRVIVTTCYDRLLEHTLREAGIAYLPVVGNAEVAYAEESEVLLVWLWGVLDQPESIVITKDDQRRFREGRTNLSDVLRGELARRTWLLVGFDAEDEWFQDFYDSVSRGLDRQIRCAYILGTPGAYARAWWMKHDARIIGVEVESFLVSLTEQLAARKRPPAPVVSPVKLAPAPPTRRPYKLLDYYEVQDASIFFGRQQETQIVSSLIHAHRLVLLYGASGVGKTSLLLAGVVPSLESTDLAYELVYVRAIEDPARVIRRAVRRKLPKGDLPTEGSLVDFLDAATRALGHPLVIILDQFEEFFIRLSPEFRAAFIAELGALYDARDVPVKVVLSLRGDWLESISEIEKRIPDVFHIKMRLKPLALEQARLAVTAPAAQLGVRYEPALVERLLSDLVGSGPGADVMPPQLQLVCSALYDRLQPGERLITLADYEQLGTARGLLHKYLDEELARLGKDEQALARDALEELVTSQCTKSVKAGSELAQALGVGAIELQPVLEKLVRARLLRPVEREGAERAFELAHECLIAEIALSPEAVVRKEAEELVRQGVENWRRFGALFSAETFALVDAQCNRLRLDAEAQELMLRNALRHGQAVARWLVQVQDEDKALTLAQEALVKPQGEAARQDLSKLPGDVAPGRLRALATRLASSWRSGRRPEGACVSDALWALRAYLPRGLRAQLAVRRSPRLLRRMALPIAATLATVLVFGAVIWGPRLWVPKPQIEWVEVPAGEFLMGSDLKVDTKAEAAEQPQHQVYLDAYRIGRYEVTNAQYAQCVRSTACKKPGNTTRYSDSHYANHPVVYVSWFEAREFCLWIGGDLPTEAQWEKAARGTDGRIYPWGNAAPTCERANYSSCSGGTMEVGQHSPAGDSPYGVGDMAGNALEWTRSLKKSYPYNADDGREDVSSSNSRVLRGGAYNFKGSDARAAFRYSNLPSDIWNNNGFRCVQTKDNE